MCNASGHDYKNSSFNRCLKCSWNATKLPVCLMSEDQPQQMNCHHSPRRVLIHMHNTQWKCRMTIISDWCHANADEVWTSVVFRALHTLLKGNILIFLFYACRSAAICRDSWSAVICGFQADPRIASVTYLFTLIYCWKLDHTYMVVCFTK